MGEVAPRVGRSGRRVPVAAMISGAVLAVLVLCALFAPLLAPYPPGETHLDRVVRPPTWLAGGTTEHLLGTDRLGRDVLSRLIFGARTSLSVSVLGLMTGAAIGSVLGLIAGFYRGWVDGLIMRAADVTLSLPLILVALALAVILGPGIATVLVVIVIVLWARFARQVRADALAIRERDYVASARISGVSGPRIIARHILPGALDTLVVLATLQLAAMILLESALSFLGVGLPPDASAWGVMVADGLTQLIIGEWWIAAFPAAAISLAVLSVNLLGDWMRDTLDPRLRNT